ncbi:MAG: tRNA pseudouridine(54/55) synthase Pus10 [Candidatus Diapherotrites archaeon]|nr:tRNA pseudouridine(54/55) synthase Pus10 [Candidatus Diapherotrites archaeon]
MKFKLPFEKIDENNLDNIAEYIFEKLKDYEFSSFMVGFSFEKGIDENIKKDFRRKIQYNLTKKLSNLFSVSVNYNNPDLSLIVDINKKNFSIYVRPVYLFGRYKKYSREISQTVFYCPYCKGRGCLKCNMKGKLNYISIEELLRDEILTCFEAERLVFHGAGREDIDVRMLGNGRPFVVELIGPKKRNVNLQNIVREINRSNENKFELVDLQYCDKAKIVEIKNSKHDKKYCLIAESDKAIEDSSLDNLKNILNRELVIYQRTPIRVSARRSDVVRRKKISLISFEKIDERSIRVVLVAEHGTYIKEFVSSDNGRTKPSLSSILGLNLLCKELDVLEII